MIRIVVLKDSKPGSPIVKVYRRLFAGSRRTTHDRQKIAGYTRLTRVLTAGRRENEKRKEESKRTNKGAIEQEEREKERTI